MDNLFRASVPFRDYDYSSRLPMEVKIQQIWCASDRCTMPCIKLNKDSKKWRSQFDYAVRNSTPAELNWGEKESL